MKSSTTQSIKAKQPRRINWSNKIEIYKSIDRSVRYNDRKFRPFVRYNDQKLDYQVFAQRIRPNDLIIG